ncbi:MAG: DUF4179 domain-containing protein [Firmicutes bacterium]|nr:DUF4179 domain-containing protein [Bacillota bacterium]
MTEFEKTLKDLKNEPKDAEALSEEEKKSILGKTLLKIGKKRRLKTVLSKKTAIVCAVAIVCIGAVSAATEIFNMKPEFARYFRTENNQDVPAIGTDISLFDEKHGIKLTAEQVIGDDFGFYVLLKLKGDGSSEYTFESVDVNVEGSKVTQCSDLVQIGCEDADSASYMLHIITDGNVIGKRITISCKNAGINNFDPDKQEYVFDTARKGTWKISWALNYNSVANAVDVNREVNVFGGTVNWKKVSISPVSATVFLEKKTDYQTECEEPNDTLIVQLKDGTRFRSDYADSSDVLNNVDTISLYFGRIVDFNDVESISFSGETVQINENDSEQNRISYANNNVGITVSLTEKLNDVISNETESKGKDPDLNVEVKSIKFTGKIDNVENMLFEILAYSGTYTREQFEILKPMDTYLISKNDRTYTIRYGEPESEEGIKCFAQIMNDDVEKIAGWIEIAY